MKREADKGLTEEDWEACVRVLKAVRRDMSIASRRAEFFDLINEMFHLTRRRARRERRAERRAADEEIQKQAALGRERSYDQENLEAADVRALSQAQKCYVCKKMYTEIHLAYHMVCPECLAKNLEYRNLRVDMSGRVAIVTGGRIKIGYRTALRLLRDGADVLATTRFPADALARYASEPDFAEWSGRLKLYGLDLRLLPDVERFCDFFKANYVCLDVLINNAALTIWRPPQFYSHLLEAEERARLAPPGGNILQPLALSPPSGGAGLTVDRSFFPVGAFDRDRQQVDARPANSWSAHLDEVAPVELVEAHLVNAMAPFLLCARLKALLAASPFERRFVVNVSSMEGQFARENKTSRHPHTNMAKAALNMMTRTSGADFARNNIYMTAVDTGWVTNENPLPKANWMRSRGFVPPLDLIDGAARILHPVYDGIRLPEVPHYGVFLKDYAPYAW